MSKAAVLKLKGRLRQELRLIHTLDMLKQISVSEFRHLDSERNRASEFTKSLRSFFRFYGVCGLNDNQLVKNESKVPAVVAISSDSGFLGALNNQIIARAADAYQKNPETQVIVLGRRGATKLKELGVKCVSFPGIPFPLEYRAAMPLKAYLMNQYMKRQIGSVEIIYAHCHTFTRQSLATEFLLPFVPNEDELGEGVEKQIEHSIQEPDFQKIFEYTVSLCFGRRLYEIFWDSKLSEVANRSIELNGRYETLSRKSEKTRSQYFRANHEVIDIGIREIFASRHFFEKMKKTRDAVEASKS